MRAEELLETLKDDDLKNRANSCFLEAEDTSLYKHAGPDEKLRLLTEADFYLKALIWRQDARIAERDFRLEKWVIGLISVEIVLSFIFGFLGLWEGRKQGNALDRQVSVLSHMDTTSAETAKELTALQRTTELMNATLQLQLDALRKSAAETARSAKAGEASASTASKALHVSERAYVHMVPSLDKPPSAGEKPHYSVVISNSGRTPALEMIARMTGLIGPSTLPSNEARSKALDELSRLHSESASVGTLPAGQTVEEDADAPAPLTQADVDQLTQGKTLLYIFADVSYKDIFRQPHHTEICAFYQPASKAFSACHEHNKSD